MEYHRISFIHNNTEYSFVKAIKGNLSGQALTSVCRVEVRIYMNEHNMRGDYVLTGVAEV